LTIGWISVARSSRQPLRGFLRMRNSVNAIKDFPHAEERPRARLEARNDADAASALLRGQFHHTLLCRYDEFPAEWCVSCGLVMILRLLVALNMTARCICSGSAAGFPLQVVSHDFGQTAPSQPPPSHLLRRFRPHHIDHIASLALARPPGPRDQPYIVIISLFYRCPIRNQLSPA
jgi:hypothetical protein